MYHSTIFVLLALTAPIFAELEVFDGPCPTDQVKYVKDFNQEAFSGTWYALLGYQKTEVNDCINGTYVWRPDERQFAIAIGSRNISAGVSQYKYLLAKEQEENSNNGKLYQWEFPIYSVNGNSVKLAKRSDSTHHYIVNTDNKEFAIVWTCTEKETTNEQNLLVLTKGNLSNKALFEIFRTLIRPPFDVKRLKHFDHDKTRCYTW